MAGKIEIEEMEKLLEQVPPEGSDLLETFYTDYVTNGYILYDGRKNKAACTRCGTEWDLYPGEYARMHGLREDCPYCGAINILLAAGRGRQCYTEYHRVMSFAEAGGTLWAFLNYIIVDFRDMGRPHLRKSLDDIYAINKDRQHRWTVKATYYGDVWYETVNNMNVPSAPTAPYMFESKWKDHIYTNGLKEMIARSDCRYVPVTDKVLDREGIYLPTYIGTMMKYHSVELLAKAGFKRIAQHKIDGHGCRAVNWRGKSLEKILKLPTGDVRRLRPWDPTCSELEAYQQLSEKERREINIPLLRDMLAHSEYDYKKNKRINTYRQQVEQFMPFDKWCRWAKTQEYYMRPGKHGPQLLRDYKDYMRFAEKLGMDLYKKSVLRPKDLKQAHDDLMNRWKEERDDAIAKAIAENNHAADFKMRGLMIIPAMSQEDLNRETAKLGHCVHTYGNKLARGECFIFFVRDVKAPDVPYYTLETRPNGELVQCRGLHNCSMTDEVKLFTDAFVKKLKAEIRKERKEKCQTA